jgi:thiamine biosynthesis lipoprotein
MGTTYHVTIVTTDPLAPEGLQDGIDSRLEEVNRHLSSWDAESEVSRFNRFSAVGEEFPISEDFRRVMRVSSEVFMLSEGAWDGTVGPLLDLWGFGPRGRVPRVPSPESLTAVVGEVGFDQIEIRETPALVKRQTSIALDLSSIAKGYGVDAVAEVVRTHDIRDFLVEIGGEVFASGLRPDGRPWRVGINRPDPAAPADDVYSVVSLRDEALATSGDYRSFFVEDGARRSHILDPRTGRPVTNGVVSATVLAPSCMRADGLATAVMVMGADAGLALIERLDDVGGLIVVQRPDGALVDYASGGMHLQPPPD